MQKDIEKKRGTLDKWMDFIERVGNALPDPVSLFIILAVIVVVLSAIFGSMGMSAVHPGTGKTITVVNLLTKDGFRQMYSKAVNNFASFAPLGMVLLLLKRAASWLRLCSALCVAQNPGLLPLRFCSLASMLTLPVMPALSLCRLWLL